MEEELKPEPKISSGEAILIGIFLGILDLVDLIPLAGDITDIFTVPLDFYYFMKGIRGTTFIVAQIIDLIPVLQEFPVRSIAWWITVYVDHHPKLEAKLEIAGGIVQGAEGVAALGGAEEAGAAAEATAATAETEAAAAEATAATAETGGNALEMTETEPGTWEYQPEAAGEVSASGESGMRSAETAEETGAGSEKVKPEELGEKPEAIPELKKELLEEPAEAPKKVEESEEEATKKGELSPEEKAQKVKEQLEKLKPLHQAQSKEEEEEEEEDEEDPEKAA